MGALREAGAIVVGKAHTNELAFGIDGRNPHRPPCLNPHDHCVLPGGSSSGPAVAVAAGLVLGALGTDTSGSIRVPCALCGVAGLRPSLGRVALRGVLPLAPSYDVVGPIAGCVDDVRLLFGALLSGGASSAATRASGPTMGSEGGSGAIRRVRVIETLLEPEVCDPGVAELVRHAAEILVQIGVEVESVAIPVLADALAVHRDVQLPEAAASVRALGVPEAELGREVRDRVQSAELIAEVRHRRALLERERIARAIEEALAPAGALLAPGAAVAAPCREAEQLRVGSGAPRSVRDALLACTVPLTQHRGPVLSLPVGTLEDALPVGIQLLSRPGWDERLLELGIPPGCTQPALSETCLTAPMAGEIVVFGATGYTGELTARALLARGATPILAARNPQRLSALASELGGLEARVADRRPRQRGRAGVRRRCAALDRRSLHALGRAGCGGGDRRGSALHRLHGGERLHPPRVRGVGPARGGARQSLLTAFAFDWVPGNLAAALALREAGAAASRVEVAYVVRGAGSQDMSGGTRASVAAVMVDPSFSWRGGRIVDERGARRVKRFTLGPGERAAGFSVGTSEAFALPRLTPALADVEVYVCAGAPAHALAAFSAVTDSVCKLPGARVALRALAARAVTGSTGGPDAARRARSGSSVIANSYDAGGGLLSEVRLEGVNVYTFTAEMLAWGALAAASGELRGVGALGPVDGFGLEKLQQGAAEAGLAVVA